MTPINRQTVTIPLHVINNLKSYLTLINKGSIRPTDKMVTWKTISYCIVLAGFSLELQNKTELSCLRTAHKTFLTLFLNEDKMFLCDGEKRSQPKINIVYSYTAVII